MLTPDQIAARQHGIGGSDAPTIAHMNPYKQPLQLWMEKTGQWEPEDLSQNDAVHFGNELEAFIATEWQRRNDVKVRRDNRTFRHPDHEFMIGHIDRRIVGKDEGLEIKNRNARMAHHYGAHGTDQVYESDMIQCMHYMACTGWSKWHLAVYFGGGDFRMYTVERDDELISDLIALEADFWNCVETKTRPPIAWDHSTTKSCLSRLYPGTNEEIIDLPAIAEHWHQVRVDAAELEKKYKAVKDGADLRIQEMLGESAVGLLPESDGGYRRKQIDKAAFSVDAHSYVDMRYTKKPAGVPKK